MRFVTFSSGSDPRPRLGAITGDRVTDLASNQGPATLLELIQQREGAARHAGERAEAAGAPTHLVTAIRLHAPIPRPVRNVFGLGLNYAAHARESSRARGAETRLPTVPVFFTKATTTINGPFDDVPVDWSVTTQVDWEVELAIVIGRRGRNIPRDRARDHVFGYTAVNDFSARDLQTRHLQWFKGKSLDASCPIGPVIVTADEFGDPQRKRLQVRVNGITKQDSTTADMIFPVDQIIEWLSKGLTLEPGDIIATGTPEGVGMGRTPQEFLKEGDVVETEIEDVGVMRNRIVALEHAYTAE